MKQFFVFLFYWVCFIAIFYVLAAFIELNYNPYWWSVYSRVALSFLSFISVLPAGWASEKVMEGK